MFRRTEYTLRTEAAVGLAILEKIHRPLLFSFGETLECLLFVGEFRFASGGTEHLIVLGSNHNDAKSIRGTEPPTVQGPGVLD